MKLKTPTLRIKLARQLGYGYFHQGKDKILYANLKGQNVKVPTIKQLTTLLVQPSA